MKTASQTAAINGTIRAVVLVLLGCIGFIWVLLVVAAIFVSKSPTAPEAQTAEAGLEQTVMPAPIAGTPTETRPAKNSYPRINPLAQTAATAPSPEGPRSPKEVEALVQSLVHPSFVTNGLTAENAAAWGENLRQLVHAGTQALPAIHAYLERNVDLDFGATGRRLLGYGSLRLALLDAAAAIGGPEAVTTLSGVLQVTADPREIALITQNLERLDPGQHYVAGLHAARQTLDLAANGELGGRDVAPAFEVLQRYGDASVIPELEQSAQHWGVYAAVALAQLPEGAGLPSLLQMAADKTPQNSQARVSALKMLAQMAPGFDHARSALLEQLKSKQISAYDLLAIAPVLAGDQILFRNSVLGPPLEGLPPHSIRSTFIPASNQSFINAPLGAMTPGQISERRAFIRELMDLAPDPAARAALERANVMLSKRSPQVAGASTTPGVN